MNMARHLIFITLSIILLSAKAEDCPDNFPFKYNNVCLALNFDLRNLSDSQKKCEDLAPGAELAIVSDIQDMQMVLGSILDFIKTKIGKANYWVGMYAEPPPMPGEERETNNKRWKFDFDDSAVDENEYILWDKEPEGTLECAIINGTRNFSTVAVDCDGLRFPVVCAKLEPCYYNNKPFFIYGDLCLSVLNEPLEYNRIHEACSIGKPAPIKDKHQKELLIRAITNGFMGGAIFTALAKDDDGNWRFPDGSEPRPSDWVEDEPRDTSGCAGLSIEKNNIVKFRTMNCGILASSLCSLKI